MGKYRVSPLTVADEQVVFNALAATYGTHFNSSREHVKSRIASLSPEFVWMKVEDNRTKQCVSVASMREEREKCYNIRVRFYVGATLDVDLGMAINGYVNKNHGSGYSIGYVAFGSDSEGWF